MTINYNCTGSDRKKLVAAIAEITGAQAKYCGAPTFAYHVGSFTVGKNGALSFDDRADSGKVEQLIEALCEKGFDAEVEEVINGLSIQLPRKGISDTSIENLKKLIESKAGLIKKALGAETLPLEISDDTICFPWFTDASDPDAVKAYTHLVTALCEIAKTQKRVSATEKPVENEKYAFRCFLLRLGFIGSEYKTERKILLSKMTGSSAFKNPSAGGIYDE